MSSRRWDRLMLGNVPRPVSYRRGPRGARLLAGLAAGALTVAALVLPAQAASAAATQPPGGGAVELNAKTAPSVVYLEITQSGYMRFGPSDEWLGPYDVVSACTGFFVTGTGHLVSAGHCVEETEGRRTFIDGALSQAVANGTISEADKQSLLPEALQFWQVEGEVDNSPLARQVVAVQPKSVSGAVLTDAVPARIVDVREFTEGDLALLKVETGATTPLPIAKVDPASGAPITAIGFPGSVSGVVNPATLPNPTFNSGTVASTQVSQNGVAQIGVNAPISGGMSGGPTIDQLGNVVGVNSFGIEGESQPFNFITDTTDLSDWIGSKNLQLAAPRAAVDQTQPASSPVTDRAAQGVPSWVWIVVGAVALLIVAVVVLAVVLRRRGGSGPGMHTPIQQTTSSVPPGTYGSQPGPYAPWNGPYAGGPPPPGGSSEPVGASAGGVATDEAQIGTCTNCRTSNGPGSRFCNGCGTAI